MNYRHAYHAGNIGDVLKHVVLVALLDRLTAKPTPFLLLDTHAGRGLYDLQASESVRGNEWRDGIGQLTRNGAPPEISRYLDLIATFNDSGDTVRHYPGSPLLALAVIRKEDRKVFVEKHPEEAARLQEATRGRRNLSVLVEDGYITLRAQLPPRENRGLVLIDPSYEDASEFSVLANALVSAYRRWPNGMYCAWYPIKAGADIARLHDALVEADVRKSLVLELTVRPQDTPTGLAGSGLIIINPPWQFDARMQEVVPALHRQLSPVGAGRATIEWLIAE